MIVHTLKSISKQNDIVTDNSSNPSFDNFYRIFYFYLFFAWLYRKPETLRKTCTLYTFDKLTLDINGQKKEARVLFDTGNQVGIHISYSYYRTHFPYMLKNKHHVGEIGSLGIVYLTN